MSGFRAYPYWDIARGSYVERMSMVDDRGSERFCVVVRGGRWGRAYRAVALARLDRWEGLGEMVLDEGELRVEAEAWLRESDAVAARKRTERLAKERRAA
jgi:hypothetical protein